MYLPKAEALEQLIDKNSLNDVLQTIADICYAKGEHLEVNWQDPKMGKSWNVMGRRLERLADACKEAYGI